MSDHLRRILISDIVLRNDVVHRSIDGSRVDDLVRGFRVVGMTTPIRVRPTTIYVSGVPAAGWELVAGQHRVEAAKLCGWEEIDANVEDLDDKRAELAMHTENLERSSLSPAEEAYALKRAKALYEELHPETRSTNNGGGGRKNETRRQNGDDIAPRFTAAMSDATGKSERALQRATSIADELGPDVLVVAGTSLDTQTELEALRKLKRDLPDQYVETIERAAAGEQVSARPAQDPKAAQRDRFWKMWASLDDDVRQDILAALSIAPT